MRSVATKWLVSAVARAMQPGCNVDTMLILEGRQGIGKSRALATLARPQFFSDAAIDFGTKDACQTIQGVWIFELAELDAILRRDPSTVKAFLSRATDRFRVPYGRIPENVPRGLVFAGTVNHSAYLRDTSGNRRYWIVRCEEALDIDGLAAARDQLWAEALHRYRAGETWHLGATFEHAMADVAEARVEYSGADLRARRGHVPDRESLMTLNLPRRASDFVVFARVVALRLGDDPVSPRALPTYLNEERLPSR